MAERIPVAPAVATSQPSSLLRVYMTETDIEELPSWHVRFASKRVEERKIDPVTEVHKLEMISSLGKPGPSH